MAIDRRAILRKAAKATVSGTGVNFSDGRGRLVVKRLAFEDGFEGVRFVADFVVLASQKIPIVSLKTGQPLDIAPNPAGTEVNYVLMLDKHESAYGNMKNLFLSLYGEAECSEDEFVDAADEATEKNTARGLLLDYSTIRKVTKEKKVEITIPKWATVPDQDQDKWGKWLDAWVLGSTMTSEAKA